MVALPGIDQVVALATPEINAIPFGAVESKACNEQGLALLAGDLHPIVGAAHRIATVANLRDDALQAGLARMLEHLAVVDLETL